MIGYLCSTNNANTNFQDPFLRCADLWLTEEDTEQGGRILRCLLLTMARREQCGFMSFQSNNKLTEHLLVSNFAPEMFLCASRAQSAQLDQVCRWPFPMTKMN